MYQFEKYFSNVHFGNEDELMAFFDQQSHLSKRAQITLIQDLSFIRKSLYKSLYKLFKKRSTRKTFAVSLLHFDLSFPILVILSHIYR